MKVAVGKGKAMTDLSLSKMSRGFHDPSSLPETWNLSRIRKGFSFLY